MANLLSGLENLGLGDLSGMDIYASQSNGSTANGDKSAQIMKLTEADFLFDKTYQCPVCSKMFRAKTVKSGKVRLESVDSDLRPKYKDIDTLKYDAIVCTNCGYASLSRYFNYMTRTYAKIIKESISSNFVNTFKDVDSYSYDEAITRHKLALLNAVMKRAKDSEKAYTCLKIAWLLRGQAENLDMSEEGFTDKIRKIRKEEEEFMTKAYEGFQQAYIGEAFPMCGMDEQTFLYMNADIARRLERYDEALRLVSRAILIKSTNNKLKDKARELKQLIRDEMKISGIPDKEEE